MESTSRKMKYNVFVDIFFGFVLDTESLNGFHW